jgi:hypothetical protein
MNSTQDFYEIYDYCYPEWWTHTWIKVLLGCTAILIIGLIVYFIITKKKKTPLPWAWADEQLKKLSCDACKNKVDFKKYYFSLTSILKQYFQVRYFWQTEDKTDEELIQLLQEQQFDQQQLEQLKKIFTGATWIKFANEDALRSQALEDRNKAIEIVAKTRPSDYKNKS